MGTADLGAEARKRHRADVWVLEPPIDVERDNPEISGREFRSAHNVTDDEFLIVSVSRLALDLKLDALVRGIDAVDQLASRGHVKLILVGDGPARDALQCRADDVNRRHGREVVTLVGADPDPRSAYAAADLVIAMGSSALRAMAIGRPLIVQGEEGFSELFEQNSWELFLRQGFYGLADGAPGPHRLVEQIEPLIDDPARRLELGQFGRAFVSRRFSLQRAVDLQLDVYKSMLKASPVARFSEAMRAAGLAASVEIANHNPFQKRRNRNLQKTMLSAARSGEWPPSF
jgi:glycosyltransferase involved in cell wall biosynthesis